MNATAPLIAYRPMRPRASRAFSSAATFATLCGIPDRAAWPIRRQYATENTVPSVPNRDWEQGRQTVLFIAHDVDEALRLADTVYVMTARPGQIKRRLAVERPRPRT